MIKSIVLLFLVCYQLFGQEHIDKDVVKIASHYRDTLLQENWLGSTDIYLIVSVEETETSRRIYVTACNKLHDMISEGIPDSYERSNGLWIFVFARNAGKSDDHTARRKFLTDFRELLDKEDTTSIDGFRPVSFLYQLRGSKVLNVRKICGFPFPSFVRQGKTFDQEGNLMYEDGVYDLCNVRIQGGLTSKSPLEIVRENTHDSLSTKSLGAELTINELGKVESVRLSGEDVKTLTERTKSQLVQLLKNMPRWGKGTISGRPVKYRVFAAL